MWNKVNNNFVILKMTQKSNYGLLKKLSIPAFGVKRKWFDERFIFCVYVCVCVSVCMCVSVYVCVCVCECVCVWEWVSER